MRNIIDGIVNKVMIVFFASAQVIEILTQHCFVQVASSLLNVKTLRCLGRYIRTNTWVFQCIIHNRQELNQLIDFILLRIYMLVAHDSLDVLETVKVLENLFR